MGKNTNNQNANTSVVFRQVRLPVWAVALIAMLPIAIVLLNACGENAQASQTPVTSDPTKLPEGAQACTNQENPEIYDCPTGNNYKLTLSHVPSGITPFMLPNGAEESQLGDSPKDGIGCVVFIAGNLAFYNSEETLVTSFLEPVTLELQYTDNESNFQVIFNQQNDPNQMVGSLKEAQFDDQLIECANNLKEKGIAEIDLVPIYLYTPQVEGYSNVHIWKPFQNFEPTKPDDTHTMTIEFLYWGDQQVGGGTRP